MKNTKEETSFILLTFLFVFFLFEALSEVCSQSQPEARLSEPVKVSEPENESPGKKLSDLTHSGNIITYSGNA